MSDWIERDGKKYFEESYLKLANQNAKRAMRSRAEVEAALKFAREKYKQIDRIRSNGDNPGHKRESATVLCQLWAGRIDAYQFVLGIMEGKESE